jgi:hypothetical protein
MSWRSKVTVRITAVGECFPADYQVGQDHPQSWLCLLEVVFNYGVAAWIAPKQTEPCLAA